MRTFHASAKLSLRSFAITLLAACTLHSAPAQATDADYDMIGDAWEQQLGQSITAPRYSLDLRTSYFVQPTGANPTYKYALVQSACVYVEHGYSCWEGESNYEFPLGTASRSASGHFATSGCSPFGSCNQISALFYNCGINADQSITCTIANRKHKRAISPTGTDSGWYSDTAASGAVFGNLSITLPVQAVQIMASDKRLCAITTNDQQNLACWTPSYTGNDNVNQVGVSVTSFNMAAYTPTITPLFDADLDGTANTGDSDDDNDGLPDSIDPSPYDATESSLPLDSNYHGSAVTERADKP